MRAFAEPIVVPAELLHPDPADQAVPAGEQRPRGSPELVLVAEGSAELCPPAGLRALRLAGHPVVHLVGGGLVAGSCAAQLVAGGCMTNIK